MRGAGTDGIGAGGKASPTALAGTITVVVGLVLAVFLGPIGVFLVAFGGFLVLASPALWLLTKWDARSDG